MFRFIKLDWSNNDVDCDAPEESVNRRCKTLTYLTSKKFFALTFTEFLRDVKKIDDHTDKISKCRQSSLPACSACKSQKFPNGIVNHWVNEAWYERKISGKTSVKLCNFSYLSIVHVVNEFCSMRFAWRKSTMKTSNAIKRKIMRI